MHKHVLRDGVDESLEVFFRLLAIFNVGPGQVPTRYRSLIIEQRFPTNEKPTITPIASSKARFCFPGLSVGDGSITYLAIILYVVWMKAVGYGFDKELSWRQAMIVTGSLIAVKSLSICTKNNDVLRNRVDKLLQLPFRLLSIITANHGILTQHILARLSPKP
jgi:hypothetical protein